jgi:hypothetical protein
MTNVIDLVERVELLFSDKPDKRKKKEHKEWEITINLIIDELNKLCKFKMYNKIK